MASFSQTPTINAPEKNVLSDSAYTTKGPVLTSKDSLQVKQLNGNGALSKAKRDWTTWRPSPKRALWLAPVAPRARPPFPFLPCIDEAGAASGTST